MTQRRETTIESKASNPEAVTRISGWRRHSSEQILFVAKRHPLTLLGKGLIVVVAWLLPYLAFSLVGLSLWFSLSFVIGGLTGILVGYSALYSWSNSNYILTSERVIAIMQDGFFNRSVAEAQLPNILAVRYDVPGMLRSICNFGTVTVQASGVQEEGDVILKDVPDPYWYQEKIAEAQSQAG